MPYRDLREFLEVLERHGRLHRVRREVEKEWEISAVCRKVFQKIPSDRRPAVLFERVKGHTVPMVAGILGGSRHIYAMALETDIAGILDKWDQAQQNPVAPTLVATGPCKENVVKGDNVDLTALLPVPIWTVGEDPGPYITSPYVFTKDPETGVRNVGTYRVQLKGPRKVGLFINYQQDAIRHIRRAEELGQPLPVAIVLGTDPVVGLCSVSNLPYGVDEVAVAGGLRGAPVELVSCETVPLEVPATAEIVIEGFVHPGARELEGPFGEYPGYMGPSGSHPYVDVTCVTYRNNPIYQAFVSQMPPSESSCIRGLGMELTLQKHLVRNLGLPVTEVHFRESGGSSAWIVIKMKKEHEAQPKQAIWGAWGWDGGYGKITIVVDDDIDIRDPFQVEWAMSFRMQPARDIFIIDHAPPVRLDPSLGDVKMDQQMKHRVLGSKIGIDATMKGEFPAKAIPPQEHLRRVEQHWEEYGFRAGD